MTSASALRIQDSKLSSLGLSKSIINKEKVCCYTRSLDNADNKNPILVLIHGYPQSAYMWRHVIPQLPSQAPLFVPDLPGYGASAPIERNDKLSVGTAVLEALKTEVKKSKSADGNVKIVLIGHDRGGRVAHRLTVSGVDGVDILGVCLIDIVPTSTQWQNFASPATTAKGITGYFHWPLLANVDLATRMITAFGPSNWCQEMILRWAGGENPACVAKLKADDALTVYGDFFAQEHTLKASCEDYKEGATTDLEEQEKDQKEGRKIEVPVLLLYSEAGIGTRFNFPDVWREWVREGVKIENHGLGDGVGHFGAEEAPDECVEAIIVEEQTKIDNSLVEQHSVGPLPQTNAERSYESKTNDLKLAVSDLNLRLSEAATITFPWDARWNDLQVRGSSPRISPDYNVVVEVATESDVQSTVAWANRLNIPFLAVTGGHGWTTTLNKLSYGIQINMRKLNTTTLSRDGKTAMVGGGTMQHEITRSLFALGKYAVTGLSECVSVAGPLLGGGHSLLQSQHGYSLDGLVSARVVLASGKVVEASQTRNADLFWALQGSGHNFGIVTSLEVKTYDIPSNWTVYSLIYKTDKVEALFRLINEFEEPATKRPAKLALTGVFVRIPAVDPINPVVAYTVAYEGTEAEAEPYALRFKALDPVSTIVSTNVNYVELYTVTGNNLKSQACTRNENIAGAGVSLPAWDLEGVRKAFTIFGNITADPRFNTSITLMENYGMQGVRAIETASTAMPPEERDYPILASPVLWWAGNDAQATKDAYAYTHAMREALYTGLDKSNNKRHCYVNYANGDESKPEMYGDNARLAKLAELKSKWDPKNRFGFYNPIV
ncbi:hypothetical protein ACET3X_007620 [Alternaria dauci]|uniref:FAD-binding PCMH-type domain-containing protein n=1 Tax=Alternaria dauci TaxID=48095 RepID=A0ABR3UCY5_9PLEO